MQGELDAVQISAETRKTVHTARDLNAEKYLKYIVYAELGTMLNVCMYYLGV